MGLGAERDFSPDKPNSTWAMDITYVWTGEGWLYLAVVLDLFSRMVVGWPMSEHIDTKLVLGALEMALEGRQPPQGLIHHSDRGSQYTSYAFGKRCQEAGIMPSMGSVGDATTTQWPRASLRRWSERC